MRSHASIPIDADAEVFGAVSVAVSIEPDRKDDLWNSESDGCGISVTFREGKGGGYKGGKRT